MPGPWSAGSTAACARFRAGVRPRRRGAAVRCRGQNSTASITTSPSCVVTSARSYNDPMSRAAAAPGIAHDQLAYVGNVARAVTEEVGRAFIGAPSITETLLAALVARGHVL